MTGLCVTGYGSLDYAITLNGFAEANHTTLVSQRDPQAWPRIGGCPAYVARSVAARVGTASVVSWMGNNDEGRLYCDGLAAAGIDMSGIAMVEAVRSPTAVLVYQSDGSCACLYDPALGGQEKLTPAQRMLIGQASHLCITVGPAQLTTEIIEARRAGSRLYWVTKNDTAVFTPQICRLISAQADVIICNRAERALVGETRDDVIIVETRGQDGVFVSAPGIDQSIQVARVEAADTTGAGDTFAGGYIAAEMDGISHPVQACEQAVTAARLFLQHRQSGDAP